MNYLSIEFSILFFIFFCLYWSLSTWPILQNGLLLMASYAIVVSFNYLFAIILATYSFLIYILSILIARSHSPRFWFTISSIIAIGNLAIFKYFDFFSDSFQQVIDIMNIDFMIPSIEILMPIGISFYTFHSISYLVSIKRKEINLPNPLSFFLFLSFFPSIIAGPINRATNLLPQINTKERRTIDEPYRAFSLILFAIVKVYWLSSFLSENWVNPVFANPSEYHSLDLILAIYAYAIEIYLNFSGYTDLVIGIAILLGFQLPTNFNLPYLAVNLRDFWQRWHISLSTWIRDYVYIPLGGSRNGFTKTQCNLMIAMLLSGLWHGANWAFIIWGAIHGIGVILLNISDRLFGRNLLSQISPFIARLITFNYVCFAWLFFRCASFSDALDYLSAMKNNFIAMPLHFNSPLQLILLFTLFIIYPRFTHLYSILMKSMKQIHWFFLPILFIVILWFVISVAPSGIPNFIYAGF